MADWQHAKRGDKLVLDFSRVSRRKDITDGFYSAHELRFTRNHEESLQDVKENDPHIAKVDISRYAVRSDA